LANKRILIVDDEPYLIRSLSFVLKKEGYEVETAQDGGEAMEVAKQTKPDLIFLDIQLPKLDGFEVCHRVKSDPELRGTYIIMLTAKGQEFDRKKGLEAGADEFLTKPFSPKELIGHLRQLFTS